MDAGHGGEIDQGESVTFTITARPTAAGSFAWTNEVHTKQDCNGSKTEGCRAALQRNGCDTDPSSNAHSSSHAAPDSGADRDARRHAKAGSDAHSRRDGAAGHRQPHADPGGVVHSPGVRLRSPNAGRAGAFARRIGHRRLEYIANGAAQRFA